jgi:transitional endoplasmic reticulum ATPase
MDELNPWDHVFVIGTTDKLDVVDTALRMCGRFEREIEFKLPDKHSRLEIFTLCTRRMPLAPGVDFEKLAEVSYDFTGADIKALCNEAARSSIRKFLPEIDFDKEIPQHKLDNLVIGMDDFVTALMNIEPQTASSEQVKQRNK